MGEPVLHPEGQSTAQGVQTEGRVGARQKLQRADGEAGHQIPVDQIAKGFVDPHAVLVDRQALRFAKGRRGGEAAKAEAGLQRVGLVVAGGDRADAFAQQIGHRTAAGPVIGLDDPDIGGNPVYVDAAAKHWGDADHQHLGQLPRRLGAGRQRPGHQGQGKNVTREA